MVKRKYSSEKLCQPAKRRKLGHISEQIQIVNFVDHNNSFALHEVCRDPKLSIKVVKDVYYAYPKAALAKDDNHHNPLYIAVDTGFEEAVDFLAKVCPKSSTICDSVGDTPLQAAIYGLDPSNIIDSIVSTNPMSAFIPDVDGNTAFCNFFKIWNVFMRLAVKDQATCDKVLNRMTGIGKWKIRDIYDNACLFLNAANLHKNIEAGSTTLMHAALREESCHFAFCKLIMKVHPEQVLVKDIYGDLPIHVIVKSKEVTDGKTFLCMDCFMTRNKLMSIESPNNVMKYLCQECLEFDNIKSKSSCINPSK